jgi:predicted lipoprotein with Yx(FWY)xxD motif
MRTRSALVVAATAAIAAVLIPASLAGQSKAVRASVGVAQSSLGRILVDGRGHTLYLFGKDKNGNSGCAGKCATFWSPLITASEPRVAGVAKASLLGTTKRADGRLQVTYNRHPLYTFVKDKQRGQTKGEGLNVFGAKWYAVSPAGGKVLPQPVGGGIPQNNGGDQDSDNNGGPSDGDGNI